MEDNKLCLEVKLSRHNYRTGTCDFAWYLSCFSSALFLYTNPRQIYAPSLSARNFWNALDAILWVIITFRRTGRCYCHYCSAGSQRYSLPFLYHKELPWASYQTGRSSYVSSAGSVLELVGKVVFAFWLVPVKGYLAVCICESVTWVICFLFISAAAFLFRKDFRDSASV